MLGSSRTCRKAQIPALLPSRSHPRNQARVENQGPGPHPPSSCVQSYC